MLLAVSQKKTACISLICLLMEARMLLTINQLKDLYIYGDYPVGFGLGLISKNKGLSRLLFRFLFYSFVSSSLFSSLAGDSLLSSVGFTSSSVSDFLGSSSFEVDFGVGKGPSCFTVR